MKISVITTTYNRKEFLPDTIKSVQKSIFDPIKNIEIEHIIYDDASTDGTADLFCKPIPGIRYIRGKENRGPSHGRNQAMALASGDYIFLIDSDDIILQRTLHNFFQVALANPQTQWFISDFLRTNENLGYVIGDDYFGWKFENPQSMLKAILKGEHFIQSNVFIKRELFDETGGFDEKMRMTEDLDLYIRFLLSNHMPIYCNFISHLHRLHNKNISEGITLEKHMEHMLDIKNKYAQEFKKRGIM